MSLKDFQEALRARGFDPGPADGQWGERTERAAVAALAAVELPGIDPMLVADLKRDEGLRLRAYPDPLSGREPWTIGYGHTGPDVGPATVWTEPHAEEMLRLDIVKHNAELDQRWPWAKAMGANRYRVVCNMCFNLGPDGLAGFVNTLRAMQEGRYADAAAGMLASKWARQVGARADRLARLMREG